MARYTVYAMWWGGSGYAQSDDQDIETFPSLFQAQRALEDRKRFGYSYRQHFEFINREPEDTLCPCVEDDSEIWIFYQNPTGWGDKYPDRIIKFGARGGVVVERT